MSRIREGIERRVEPPMLDEGEAEPLYVLPENDTAEDEDAEEEEEEHVKRHPFRVMLDILAGPVQGWKVMKRQHYKPQEVLAGLLYPLSGVAAATQFADLIYDANASISGTLIQAVAVFIAFFFGYFTITGVARSLMPKDSGEWAEKDFGKCFVAFSLATLALFTTVLALLPMLEPILVFLPLWTIYIICRGVRFLRVAPDKETSVSFILCVLLIGIPIGFWKIFGSLLRI